MDEKNNRAVRTMFKKLYDAGLIYRGDYLVNWDPVTQTALADDEVEYEERQSFFGISSILWPMVQDFLHIATTRPETMLGDTAVAVSPGDERYASLIGKEIRLPLTGRLIPIIADHHVDPEFGTGAVKVTPAHDPNDYQMGRTHNLPFINIMTPEGRINENGGKFEGLTMAEARQAVVEQLKQKDFLKKLNRMSIGLAFLTAPKPPSSLIFPSNGLSRWRRLPRSCAKRLTKEKHVSFPLIGTVPIFIGSTICATGASADSFGGGIGFPSGITAMIRKRFICDDGPDLPPEVKKNPDEWIQDPDVLDTWFSSALWPFATLRLA